MKLQIKTEFWNEQNPETWKTRYDKINYWIGAISGINTIIFLANAQTLMTILNTLTLTTSLLTIISYNKRKKEDQKCKKQKQKE